MKERQDQTTKAAAGGHYLKKEKNQHRLPKPACWQWKTKAFQEGCRFCNWRLECTHPPKGSTPVPTFPFGDGNSTEPDIDWGIGPLIDVKK